MNPGYGRDLDLNLLRVFVVVAESGSVTRAAQQLYLTQPAVTAALRRLRGTIDAPLFARHGRGIVLTSRGERLLSDARPHLQALVDATSAAPDFDPRTSDRTIRLGVSDTLESGLVAQLVRDLGAEAPRMRLVVLAVQFRTVEEALVRRRVDLAVTVADELPSSIKRRPLLTGPHRVIYDPRQTTLRGAKIDERRYYQHEHVIVSYNGDLRGFVEDLRKTPRTIRCSLPTFHAIGDVITGTPLLATVPSIVAATIARTHPKLASIGVPWDLPLGGLELLWPTAVDDDPACRFLREKIVAYCTG